MIELLKCPQWPELLRHTFEVGKMTTSPFRMIIKTMPGVCMGVVHVL